MFYHYNYKKIFTFVLIFIAISTLTGCSLNKTTDEIDINKLEEKNILQTITDKHNPIIFDDEDFIFTKEIQDLSERTFLLEGKISDLYKQDNKYYIEFNSHDLYGKFQITNEQINNIYKNDFSEYDDFFIIVKINKVFKPKFQISSELDYDYDYSYVYIADYSANDIFILEGTIIEIEKDTSTISFLNQEPEKKPWYNFWD